MRTWPILLLLAMTARLDAMSACMAPSARDLTGGARLIAVATATSATTWRIERVLQGTADAGATIDANEAAMHVCFDITPGDVQLVVERIHLDGARRILVRQIADAADDLAFLRARRIVDRDDVLRAARRWRDGKLSTAHFHGWMASADTIDTERDESVTVHVIENLEWLSEEVAKLETLDPKLAERFMKGPLTRFLAAFEQFPPIENEHEYKLAATEGAPPWDDFYRRLNETIGAMYESPEWTLGGELIWDAEKDEEP